MFYLKEWPAFQLLSINKSAVRAQPPFNSMQVTEKTRNSQKATILLIEPLLASITQTCKTKGQAKPNPLIFL